MRARVWILALTLAVALGVAGPALAHTEVQRATPAPGAVVTSTVDSIELLFLDPVLPSVVIDVATTDGAPVDDVDEVEHSEDGRTATVTFAPLAEPGGYVVSYEFVAVDGDAQQDAYRFTYDPDEGSSSGTGPFVLAAVGAAVVAVLVVALRRRRRSTRTAD